MMKTWIEKEQPNLQNIEGLQKILKIPEFICSLLIQRNINSLEEAKIFFRPNLDLLHDPFLMKDMLKVVERINISKSKKIMILGDYDVDGTTSTAMLFKYFHSTGFNVSYYIPDRYQEGYGVSIESIKYATANNISLIITVDCGIKAISQVDLAKSKGIDVVVCDHHLPGEELPRAYGIINPKQSSCNYPFKDLCGCGIAFKLITAHNLISENQCDVFEFLDFVALATISDMMPLVDENRLLVFYGLRAINSNPRIGLRNFLKSINSKIDESKVSFNIGPRINAAGRMKNGTIIVDLLVQEDREKASIMSNEVEFLNQNRRATEKNVFQEAVRQIDQTSFTNIAYSENWSKGVLGIVASRLIEQSYKPTIVMTDSDEELLTGSVRSVSGFDVYEALSKCEDNIFQFGGHKYAAGLKVKKSNFDNFKSQFENTVKKSVSGKMFRKTFSYDLLIDFSEITLENVKIISRMSPFGLGNNRPVFRTNNCFLDYKLKFIGKESQIVKSKIKDESGKELSFICFDKKETLVNANSTLDILYTINLNLYSGKEEIELTIREINLKK
ncbi:MAG: single-stranded-DNA-specific exonuclease RecJ [Candidatus Marinimicrobia bacterium]|nr:single-stranded-DNA-specific exonuclease RecJ [Candidatus Neomarinimicrobiota bacterium]